MHLFPYLAAFLLAQHIHKNIKLTEVYPKWRSLLQFANWGTIVLYFVIARTFDDWMGDITGSLILLGIVTYINKEDDFKSFRGFANTHYPLIVASAVYGVAELLNDDDPKWEMYYQFAVLAAFMWIFGRGATFKKQQKQVQMVTQKNNELETIVAERTAELTRQKNELEQTVLELKATQAQLVQQEKLASLGELTAGIAHEIQNPLNFVNNFSEVSMELIDEMEEELTKGDTEEAAAIAADIKDNLNKIRHHGKRADGIVKGMLQHSRASTGQKEPTNINTLADEYLRLAYHGLRAKDKMFNAELITQLDSTLPEINVVSQDIGRVLLNLFTNAFYATHQKRKLQGTNYKPEVTLTTLLKDDEVTVTVTDNGTGIPDEVKDKIMQPFFTTKPTGEGTGLGLSLSYDIIVKGHGGTIDVDSKEGEYTRFTITLPK